LLELFLAQKPLYYDKIDYDRFPRIYDKIKKHFRLPKIIHIVGTNAKGSTGRALAHILHKSGKSVGHYSSPHIINFNERIWINGKDVTNEVLESFHGKLLKLLLKEDQEALSYFEYTTLLAMLIFCESCEYVVLEAGLGGEYDATNVFDKVLSIITPIGFDHESFLGKTIEEIATTKINSVRQDMLIAPQEEHVVYEIARKKVEEVQSNLFFASSYLHDSFYEELKTFIERNEYAGFFYDNFATAFCAFNLLGFTVDISLLEGLQLFGRAQKIAPNITLDVGHNPMAAKALVRHFSGKKVILVYNSYSDKEYEQILKILKPIILRVEVLEICSMRALAKNSLHVTLDKLDIKYKNFEQIEADKEYLVFGSFSVAEAFIKVNNFNEPSDT
jgi:dihydrofolate synthase/folylpolyglutamate synthase